MATRKRAVDAGPTASPSERVKAHARSLGADVVGIADIDELEANPPDPDHPQVPSRVWSDEPEVAVVVGRRMPMGEFLSSHQESKGVANSTVMESLEKLSHRLCRYIEDELDEKALQIPGEDNHPAYKRGAYAPLSLRHMAAEAGLGSFGLEANLLTPEYGPRMYFAGLFTTASLEPDGLMEHQLCIGETCGRCLHACPSDAVEHFNLDKVACASAAQVHGFRGILYGPLRTVTQVTDTDVLLDMLASDEVRRKHHAIARMVNAVGACPRCVEVCPIGIDYRKFLHQAHRNIPETTKEKEDKLADLFEASQAGEYADWSRPQSERWIGREGYKPFRELLDERPAPDGDEG